jgi:transposase
VEHYIGMDIHRKFSTVCRMNRDGEVLSEARLWHDDPARMREFFSESPSGSKVVMEATVGWGWLSDMLQEMGFEVHLAHMAAVKLIAGSRLKTDRVDARALAHLLRTGFLPEAYLAPKPLRDLRTLLRHRQALIKDRTMLKNRVHALLIRHNIQLDESDIFGARGKAALRSLALPSPASKILEELLDLVEYYDVKIARTERRLRDHLGPDERCAWLTSIPGIGRLTATFLLAEIGPIERFSCDKKFVSYAGLCPSTHQSAGRLRYGSIKGSGRRLLKWVLIEASHTAVRTDSYFARIFHRVSRHKSRAEGYVAVARHMACIVWRLLKEKRAYQSMPKRSQAGPRRPMVVRVTTDAPVL